MQSTFIKITLQDARGHPAQLSWYCRLLIDDKIDSPTDPHDRLFSIRTLTAYYSLLCMPCTHAPSKLLVDDTIDSPTDPHDRLSVFVH